MKPPLLVNPKWCWCIARSKRTHLIAAGPHISCLRGTIIMKVLVSTTLYDTGAGRPAWHIASSWLAAASNSLAVVLQPHTSGNSGNMPCCQRPGS